MKTFGNRPAPLLPVHTTTSPGFKPCCRFPMIMWWREEDSNLRSRTTTDLQSVPFGRSGIPPGRIVFRVTWSWRWDSNPQPADYKSAALPIELRQRENPTDLNRNCLFKEKWRQSQVFFCRMKNKMRHPERDDASSHRVNWTLCGSQDR